MMSHKVMKSPVVRNLMVNCVLLHSLILHCMLYSERLIKFQVELRTSLSKHV